MTKQEFLEKLRAALGNDLSGAVVSENVNYYKQYITDEVAKGKTEKEREIELMQNIIETKEKLQNARKNFEYAEDGMIDYYIYQIKANQSKLDYLIKLAKKKGVILSRDKEVKIRMILQKKLVG